MSSPSNPFADLAAAIDLLRRRVERLERYAVEPYPGADPDVLLGPLDPPSGPRPEADAPLPDSPLDPRD